MSKKFTLSLLVLAATLLALPINAQSVVRKQAKPQTAALKAALKAGPQKSIDLKKAQAARLKAETKFEGQTFTGAAFANLLKNCVDEAQKEKDALAKEMERTLNESLYGHKGQLVLGKKYFNLSFTTSHSAELVLGKAPLKAPRLGEPGEVVDDNGVITAIPEGDTKIYQRAGIGWGRDNSGLYYDDQAGTIEITELADGTVYFKDFFSQVSVGTYIKGTKEGNTITIPSGQVVYFFTSSGYGMRTGFAEYDSENGFIETKAGDPYILTVDGNTISLTETSFDFETATGTIAALLYTDDDTFCGYGDNNTVFTYDPEYVAPELVELPEGAVVDTWYLEQTQVSSSSLSLIDGFANVAFVGNDVYLSGLFQNYPNSWIKGTIDGTTVTFSGLQYVGDYSAYNIFAVGCNGFTSSSTLEDFKMIYDAEAQTLTSVNNLLANAADDKIYYLEGYQNIVISKNPPAEVEATTAADVDELPYTNALDSESAFTDFGIIDSNKDGKTWTFSTSYGVYYNYTSSNNADDWLISPAIKLEAGKKYHFAIDAASASASYPEAFEVLIGTEPKASALTQSVLEETTVASESYITYENDNISVAETGYYHFGIHAISEKNMWRLQVKNFLVENGVEVTAPDAVTDFALEQVEGALKVNVSFTAPSKNVSGDDLTENLTKIDILRNGEIIKSFGDVIPGDQLTYVDEDEALKVGTYIYQVIPYNASGIGVKSEEKSIFISIAYEVPQVFDFSQNLLDQFTVIDYNEDGKTWSWSKSNGAYYPYSGQNAADDYLITLPFNLKAGKGYNVIVAARNTGYTETFEVKAGKAATVEGLTEFVIDETTAADELTEYEGTFIPAEDGEYYFAIHATSPADQFNLLISKLTIELAPEPTAPAAITNFTATAGAEGALEVNLAFTAPTTAINESALTGSVDVKIYRDNELVNTVSGVAVGEEATWKDTDVEDGKVYSYYLIAANESGDGLKSEKASVFVGVDEIGEVENIAVTATTPNTISLSWDEVAGVNGGYINTAAVKYAVINAHVETYWFWSYLVIDEVLGTVTGETSGTFDYPVDEGEQDYQYFGVVALGEDDDEPAAGDEYEGGYTWALIGAPYEVPFLESFTNGNLAYGTWAVEGCDYTYGFFTDDASDDDCALSMTTSDEPGLVRLESGRVNINGSTIENPTLVFDVKGAGVTTANVYVSIDEGEWQVVKTVDVTEDYATVKVPLADINSQRFIRFAIGTDIVNPAIPAGYDEYGDVVYEFNDVLTVDRIRIVDLFQYNLVADIQAPKSVVAGKTAKVVATVSNEGENAAEGYIVEIKANDNVLTKVVADNALAPFAKDVIEVNFETSVFDEAGDVTLEVNVDFATELVPDDNTASTIITVKEPTAVSPESLLAEDKGVRGVNLAWTLVSSENAASQVLEGFDDEGVFEPFSLGGITADEHNGAFGDWTLYDGNGIGTYSFQNLEFENDYQPMAFIVFNPNAISESVAEAYAPHSGDQYLVSFCPVDENSNAPAADHWMISPALTGDAQTISFYARVITDQYGDETFEVLASSTDTNAASFTKVADYSTDVTEWTEFTAELPAGTKYFAIRHTSTDIFGLMVDDVNFVAAGGEAPASFNVYYNGEKVGTAEGDKTSYNVPFEKISAGEQVFGVSAVYANGAESKAVTDTITIAPVEPVIAEGKYYLLNVAADGYVVGANDWGTRASITKQGGLEIEAVLANGKYELTTASVYPGKHLGFNGYVDNGDLSNWILDPVEGKDGVFMLSTDGTNVLFWDGGEATTTSVGAMPEVAEKAYWKFVSAEDRLAELKKANVENPVDATFLIVNPNFGRASNKATWQGDDYSIGGANDNFNAEKWGGNSQLFDVHQTISVPDGIYKLTWNGFYRYNNTGDNTNAVAVAAHADGTEVINSFVFANDTTFALTSIADDAAVAALTALGKELPFSQGDASFAFSNGIYEQSAEIIVKDGQLTIGVKKTDHPGTDWTVWDNFRLTYYGVEVNDDDPELVAPKGWTNLIANGNLAGDNVASFVSKEYPSTEIVGARIIAGVGKNNSRGIQVVAPAIAEGGFAWDSQFWINVSEALPEGTKLHVEFDYKADKAATVATQAHAAPGAYQHWAMIGDVNFTTEWQHFSADVDINAAMAKGDNGNGNGIGVLSIAFNLSQSGKDVTFDFDNFGVWAQLPAGPDADELVAPEGWTNLIANGNLANENLTSFVSKEYPSTDIVDARIVAGAGKDRSNGIEVVAPAIAEGGFAWDSQFWIKVSEALPEGTKLHVEFDYKADQAATVATQAHAAPGAYQHWAMIGDINFTTEWQHFSTDVDINAAMAKGDNGNGSGIGVLSIAFNLSQSGKDVTFNFDNFGVWAQIPVVDAINALKNEKNVEGIYNLNGQKVNATKKGLYILNGKKVVIK